MKYLLGLAFALASLFAPLPAKVAAQPFGGTIWCNELVVYNASTSGSTLLVAAPASGSIYLCGYAVSSAAAVSVKLVGGTTVSTACDTNPVTISPTFVFQALAAGIASVIDGSSNYRGLSVPAGSSLCINASTGAAVTAIVYFYTQSK